MIVIIKDNVIKLTFKDTQIEVTKLNFLIPKQVESLMKDRKIELSLLNTIIKGLAEISTGLICRDFGEIVGKTNIVKLKSLDKKFISVRKKSLTYSYVTKQPSEDTTKCTVEFKVIDSNTVAVVNIYFGEEVPLEVNDPKLSILNIQESINFWHDHAFVYNEENFLLEPVDFNPEYVDILNILHIPNYEHIQNKGNEYYNSDFILYFDKMQVTSKYSNKKDVIFKRFGEISYEYIDENLASYYPMAYFTYACLQKVVINEYKLKMEDT